MEPAVLEGIFLVCRSLFAASWRGCAGLAALWLSGRQLAKPSSTGSIDIRDLNEKKGCPSRRKSKRSEVAAAAFMAELEEGIDRIIHSPGRYPPYLGGTLRYLMRRFPYMIVFREVESVVQVLAAGAATGNREQPNEGKPPRREPTL